MFSLDNALVWGLESAGLAQEHGAAAVAGLMFTLPAIRDAHLPQPGGIDHVLRKRR